MIKQGDRISNPRTGQTMIFRKTGKETNGALLEIECYNPMSDAREPIHIHPRQDSSNEVLSGQLHFWVDGKTNIIGPGEHIDIPAGVPHCFWNENNTIAHHLARFSPALTIADFFDTYFALSRDGKINADGRPNFFQGSLIMLKHKNNIRVIKPPWILQIISYLVVAPLGFLMGYRSTYQSKNKEHRA